MLLLLLVISFISRRRISTRMIFLPHAKIIMLLKILYVYVLFFIENVEHQLLVLLFVFFASVTLSLSSPSTDRDLVLVLGSL